MTIIFFTSYSFLLVLLLSGLWTNDFSTCTMRSSSNASQNGTPLSLTHRTRDGERGLFVHSCHSLEEWGFRVGHSNNNKIAWHSSGRENIRLIGRFIWVFTVFSSSSSSCYSFATQAEMLSALHVGLPINLSPTLHSFSLYCFSLFVCLNGPSPSLEPSFYNIPFLFSARILGTSL